MESLTVQSLLRQLRPVAIARVRDLVATGGTLLDVARPLTAEEDEAEARA